MGQWYFGFVMKRVFWFYRNVFSCRSNCLISWLPNRNATENISVWKSANNGAFLTVYLRLRNITTCFFVFLYDNNGTMKQMDAEDAEDYFTYSELESDVSSDDESDSITLIPLTSRENRPPAPLPRSGSRSTSIRTGRSTTPAHAQRQTTTMTSGCTAMGSLNTNVVNNMAYRHRSPDVIPSLSKKRRWFSSEENKLLPFTTTPKTLPHYLVKCTTFPSDWR